MKDTQHGVGGYNYHKCRCDVCTEANAERSRAQRVIRSRRAEADPSLVPHGTKGGYTNWDCRCPECTKANTVACSQYRRSRKADTQS